MSKPIAFGDLETYSEIPLKNGTHAYAAAAEILLFTYAFGDGPVKCWDATQDPCPEELAAACQDPEQQWVWQNGGMFDYTILKHARPDLLIPHERMFDTMVCAMSHALPGSLETLCDILGVDTDKAKHKGGKQLIQLFCKPRPKTSKIRRATHVTHPEEWQQFIEYAMADITSMREVYHKLPRWNYRGAEYELWLLDQRINQRGVAIDLDLARCAVSAADAARIDLAQRTQVLTEGEVESATKRDKLLAYIFESYSIPLPDLQMATIERRLSDPDVPESLKELLRVRLQASTTSVSKYGTLLKATSSDGILRGLLQFDGAGRTRRWAGRTFQPQNLVRPTLKLKEINFAIEVLKANAADFFFDNVVEVVSNCIRSTIIARPGRKLVVSDLANIEGRVAAWLAGEDWKLTAFEAYDAGEGPDLYCVAYGKSFGVEASTVKGQERQIGKVQELMLQYEGGVGAFVTGAATYNIELDDMADKAINVIPDAIWNEAENFYEWSVVEKKRTDYGLSKDTFCVCDSLKRLWREAHPGIQSLWKELSSAVKEAITHPGVTFRVRKMPVRVDGAWLRIGLPSGFYLCYPFPQVDKKGVISYMGQNQYTRKWCRLTTYGGKLFENICQSVARDVMANAMPSAEAAGYLPVLTVHDELITETDDTEAFNVEGLSAILSTIPKWAEGMPLAAAGFEGYRYRKD